MRIREAQLLASLRAVDGFVDAHSARLGGVAGGGAHRALRAHLSAADAAATAQEAARIAGQGATRRLHAVRRALLRDHIAPLVALAGAEFVGVAEVAAFRLPRRWAGVEELAAYAEGLADTAQPIADRFVRAALRSDFPDRLREAARALREAATERRQIHAAGVGATRGLAESLRRGRKSVLVLDAMVWSAMRRDPALKESWQATMRPGAVRANHRPDEAPFASVVAPAQHERSLGGVVLHLLARVRQAA